MVMLERINKCYELKKGPIGRDSHESVEGGCRVEVATSQHHPVFVPIPGVPAACVPWKRADDDAASYP
jgi:hypothetical protein